MLILYFKSAKISISSHVKYIISLHILVVQMQLIVKISTLRIAGVRTELRQHFLVGEKHFPPPKHFLGKTHQHLLVGFRSMITNIQGPFWKCFQQIISDTVTAIFRNDDESTQNALLRVSEAKEFPVSRVIYGSPRTHSNSSKTFENKSENV